MNLFKFTGIITEEDTGYSSLCPELDIASQGETIQEAKTMLLEAVTLYLETAFEDGLPYLRPIPLDEDPRRETPAQVAEVFDFKVDLAVNAHA